MSDEDEDEFTLTHDPGVVPKAVAPQKAGKTGIPGLRTPNRGLAPFALVALCGIVVVFFGMIGASRHSGSPALANTPLLTNETDVPYHVPPAPPTPLVATPPPQATTSPPTAMVLPPFPQQGATGAALSQAPPRTPSPEDVFAEEERHRILEARRASSKIALDSNNDLAQQSMRDSQDLAQSAQMTNAEPMTGYHQQIAQGTEGSATAPHQQFLEQRSGVAGYVATRSPYELTRGTIINARLLTTVDSTLPGGVIKAMVIASVKDSRTHSVTVLPIGTILTGEGDPQTVAGEARYLSVFDRIELPAPDSRKFSMGPHNAAGAQGENGMSVSVDTHAGRDFGNAFLRAVLQAGVTVASRASTVVDIGNGTGLTQSTRSAPTFHKYAGEPFTIIVAQDLALDRFMENSP